MINSRLRIYSYYLRQNALWAVVLACVVAFLPLCSNNPTNIAGGGTGGGNPGISGTLAMSDGTPAADVSVVLRPADYLQEATAKIALSHGLKIVDSTLTDSLGNFEFDSIALGTYILECLDGEPGNGALIDSVVVVDPDSTVELEADTLKPLGTIAGQIQLPESLDASQVRVLVYGLDRVVIPDSNGEFTVSGLAEGTYSLQLQTDSNQIQAFDVSGVSVVSQETTQPPRIILPGANKMLVTKTSAAIVVDGVLDESTWGSAHTIAFSSPGFSENSAGVRTLWNSVYLYIAYEVEDTSLAVDPALEDASQDDGAEFFLDLEHDSTNSLNADDFQFFANVIDETSVLNNEQAIPSTVLTKTYRKASGYSMEIAIPWELMGKTPSDSLTMGVLFVNNDKDGPIRYQVNWLGLQPINFKNPSLWGDLILLP